MFNIVRYSTMCTLTIAVYTGLLAPHAQGQAVAIAEVAGRVSDPSGSPVAGAQVKAVETGKQQVHTTTTDDQGRYALPNLPVGSYRLEVQAPGFKVYGQSGILLQVGNNVEINATLQIGSVNESIEVTASTEMVETRDNSVSQVIDEKRIVDLPLNGRQATQLIVLSGAAVNAPGGGMTGSKNYVSSTTISVAGGQANGVNYLLDGGDHNDNATNINLPVPFPDALQEFSVQTSSLPARYGLHPGAVVNAVTKSGTNSMHGDLFEFLRNGDLNARNTFAPRHDTLKRNQFGGTLGDRIIRDKLFFFGGFQGTRQRTDPPQSVAYVPTSATLIGDFSAIDGGSCISGGKGRQLVDPVTRTPFAGDQIPVSRFNQQALNLLKYIPTSGDPCGKITYGIPSTGDEDQGIGRIDWVQNTKHSLFGRYFIADYQNPSTFDGRDLLTTTAAGNDERVQSLTLGDTYSFSGTAINSFHATVSRRRINRGPASNVINPSDLGVNIVTPYKNFLQASVSSYFSVGCGTCAAAFFNANTFQYADDVDIIRGKHQMAFGVDVVRDQLNFNNEWNRNGVFTFTGSTATGAISTGDSLADLLTGTLSSFTQSNTLQYAARATVLGFYAQDTIKMSPRLTVNLGVRWDPYLPAYDYFGRGSYFSQSAFKAGQKSAVFTNAPAGLLFYGDQGIPKAYTDSKWALFSPRLGLAWDPDGSGKQSFRVSGAILRDTTELFYGERLTTNTPWGTSISLPSPAGGLSNPYAGYPGGSPFPAAYAVSSNITFPSHGVYVNLPLDTTPTYMAQWNVSYQRQFTHDWLASVTYMGNKTTHIWVGEETNPATYIPGQSTTGNTDQRRLLSLQNPVAAAAYGSIVQSDQGGNGSYNGLLLSVQHRFAQNYTVLANYTWSHCISDDDFTGELAGSQYQTPGNRTANRGDCNFDYRDVANVSIIALSSGWGSGWARRFSRDWQLAPILQIRSGAPLTVTTGSDTSLTGVGQDRPNILDPAAAVPSEQSAASWLNRAAFAKNGPGTYGNAGRDILRGPGSVNLDFALSRIFELHENWRLEVRAEAFNAMNHVRLNNPTTSLNSSNFGIITGAADPRILQLAMKVNF
jgi:hypothetical protein